MNNISKHVLISFFTLMLLVLPVLKPASAGLVPCGTEKYPADYIENGEDKSHQIKTPCTFDHFFDLINNVVNFLFVVIALPLAAILFAYAGFLFIFSGAIPENRSKGKRIFGSVVIGFVVALSAWLIIHTVLEILGYDGSWIGF